MLYLSTIDNRRSFKVYDQNWHFLMGLLAHDMEDNCTSNLSRDNNLLNAYQCCDVSNKILKALNNNVIYEVWDGVKVEPLVNPTTEVLNNLGSTVQPLTEKRKNFLESFTKFVRSNKELHLKFKIDA